MKLGAYSVRDNKADVYDRPYFEPNEVRARRSFIQACVQLETQLGMFPEDFDLYRVGDFDPSTGVLTSQAPVHLMSAVSARQERSNG